MARYNTTSHRTKPPVALATSPIATIATKPDTRTFEGAPGWTRTAKAELFLRATGAFHGGEGTFYESAEKRDERLGELARTIALTDPQWGFEFACWLRGPGNMRTASLMFAVDFVKARLDAQQHGAVGVEVPHPDSDAVVATNRRIIDAVCQRPDEPGELLAIWTAWYGRRIPKPVKRGVADAERRLYHEKALLKYDTASHAYRFGDTLNITHPVPKELFGVQRWETDFSTGVECPHPEKKRLASAWVHPALKEREPRLFTYYCDCGWYHYTSTPQEGPARRPENRVKVRRRITLPTPQSDLFRHALDRRYNHAVGIPASLTVVHKNTALREDTRLESWLNPELLRKAGMTWEDALSAVGDKVDKARLWEALIPSMGIMAQLRNLRNFDQAGVSDKVAQQVIDRLTNPEEIARSRQFPFRFLAAYRAVKDAGSLRWLYPLEQALNHSLANVPSLGGRTLILVDRSPSMFPTYYTANETDKRLGVSRADQAAIFGCALALRAEKPTLIEFGFRSNVMRVSKGGSVLPLVDTFTMLQGTDIPSAVKKHYDNHDRVVVITDEQTRPGYFPSNGGGYYGGMRETAIDALVPLNVPVFMWNLAGYTASAMESGKNARFTLGGLTDSAFRLIPLLENGANGVWPWQLDDQGD